MQAVHKLLLCSLPVLSILVDASFSQAQWVADGRAMCTALGNQADPKLCSDGAGGVIVTWTDARSPSGDPHIYAQHVSLGGVVDAAWPVDGLALCTEAGGQILPTITSDGSGGAIVAWQDYRSGNLDVYAQHVLSSGAVDPAWPVSGRSLCTELGHQWLAAIVSDGAGGALVAWVDERGGNRDIYAQRVLSTGAVDPGWPADGRALCTAANYQTQPMIISDGGGGAIVAWEDQRAGGCCGNGERDVYAQHVLSTGVVAPGWPADGLPLCSSGGDQSFSTVASEVGTQSFFDAMSSDGAGGAIVVWVDGRSGDPSDIYSQHVLSTGTVDPAWPVNGRSLCNAPNEQLLPRIVSDGTGGGIVTWQDSRGGTFSFDIYVQHVLSTGTADATWPVNGSAVCAAIRNQWLPTIASDGSGGAIVAWQDLRSAVVDDNSDIYAQHVLSTGVVDPGWPADGRAMSTASGPQRLPTILSDGGGGAIVTWEDLRQYFPTYWDIYAQHVHADGGVAAVPVGHRQGLRVSQPQPNPTRGDVTVNFSLPVAQSISVEVFDTVGRCVRTVAEGHAFPAGTHSIIWSGADDDGTPLKSGVYLVRMNAGGKSVARKLAILR